MFWVFDFRRKLRWVRKYMIALTNSTECRIAIFFTFEHWWQKSLESTTSATSARKFSWFRGIETLEFEIHSQIKQPGTNVSIPTGSLASEMSHATNYRRQLPQTTSGAWSGTSGKTIFPHVLTVLPTPPQRNEQLSPMSAITNCFKVKRHS